MKKVISIILAISLMLTLFVSMPIGVSAATLDETALYKPTSSMTGTNYWPDQLKYEDTDEGLRIYYAEALTNNSARKASLTNAYQIDGLHFVVKANEPTLGSTYYGKLYYFALKTVKNNPDAANVLTIKLDSNASSGGQVTVTVNGVAVSNTSVASVAGATEFDFYFNLEANGDLTVSINGTDFTVAAENVTAAGIDTADLYWYSYPQVNTEAATDIVLKSIHDGDDICSKVINEINTEYAALDKTSYSYTKSAVDLYLKASKLSAEAKRYVTGYADLVEAAYTATNAKAYVVTDADVTDWWSYDTYDENGMRINTTATQFVYRHTYKAKVVDGLTAEYTLNSGYLGIALSSGTVDNKSNTKLYVKIDGTQLFVTAAGTRVNSFDFGTTSKISDTDVRIVASNINAKGSKNTFSFKLDSSNRLSMYINDVKAFTLSAEITASLALSEKLNLQLAPDGAALDVVLHYVRGGDEISMDAITEGRFNKVTASDIGSYTGGQWDTIVKTEVEDGYRIQHSASTANYAFAHWIKKAIELDGASISYTLNVEGYGNRMFNIGLSNSTGNHALADTNINFIFESNGFISVKTKGTTVSSYEYGETYTDTDFRLHCVDYLNLDIDTYEVKFALESSGALSLYLNGTKLISLSAETVAASGLNTGKTFVKFSNGTSSGALDYTLHYIRTGNLNGIEILEKPLCIAGDVNADYAVDIIDLVRAKKYLVDDTNAIFTSAADLNAEGEERINALDLSELRKLLFRNF